MAISTRTRFEVFKRDGFRCIYCGASPVERPLHVDHVEPISKGGTDDPANLVTACAECNLGKSSVPLREKRLAPNIATEADQEHAEQIREYLKLQKKIARARTKVADEFLAYWDERLGGYHSQVPSMVPGWLREFSLDRLMEAVGITSRKRKGLTQSLKYFCGILRNWRNDGSGSPPSS